MGDEFDFMSYTQDSNPNDCVFHISKMLEKDRTGLWVEISREQLPPKE